MTVGKFDLPRAISRFVRAVRGSPTSLWTVALVAVGFWFVRLPGMRPRAPKRNVIVCLVYLYALVVLLSAGSI
ncbi:hypothetical protein [Haloplanus halophilus]|uniref:hypothetical protein n=1 Tax=Haloplanus halophilus TaxID=2949993 RepID=UPI00203B6ED9|nr:hypothetical protein [Haloplanus sp. GDY1]